jgi:hypothetical protein
VSFDATGQFQVVVPLVLQMPASLGTSLFLQGAQFGANGSVSNGFQLTFCP